MMDNKAARMSITRLSPNPRFLITSAWVLSMVTATTANFGYNMSIMILVFVVLGGMGSFRGSIIAACVLTLLPEVLRGMKDYRMLIYSIVLIAMMLFNWAPKAIEMRQKFAAKFMNSKKKAQEE